MKRRKKHPTKKKKLLSFSEKLQGVTLVNTQNQAKYITTGWVECQDHYVSEFEAENANGEILMVPVSSVKIFLR